MSRASGTRCVSFAFQPELIGILQVLTDGINLFDPFELTAVLRRCVEPFVKLGTGFGALVPIQSYNRSEEHTSELQSLMRISYAVFCLKKKKQKHTNVYSTQFSSIHQ